MSSPISRTAGSRSISSSSACRMASRKEMERDPAVLLIGEDIGVYGGAFKANVFADQQDRRVALHLFEQRLPNGVEKSHQGHGYLRALREDGAAIFRLRSVCAGCATAGS